MGVLLITTIVTIIFNISLIKFLKKNKISLSKWFFVGLYIFAYYLAIMLEITGPGHLLHIGKDAATIINLVPFKELLEQKDIFINIFGLITNIILFIPLGILLPSLWEEYHKFSKTVLVGFILSLVIEILQLLNIRATDINDLIMNTLGTITGYAIYLLFKKFTLKVSLKNKNVHNKFIKYNGTFLISIILLLYFFIAPFIDRVIFGF